VELQKKMANRETSRWWRFSQYEIRDGRICVAPGAKGLQYDPLERKAVGDSEDKRSLVARSRNFEFAYRSLVAAVTSDDDEDECDDGWVGPRMWKAVTPAADPSGEVQQRILGWTRRFGSLGILHRLARQISFAGPTPDSSSLAWVRSASAWSKLGELPARNPASILEATPLRFGGYSLVDFGYLNVNYFGGRLNQIDVPSPASEGFHALYQEPLEEWLQLAVEFAEGVMEQRDAHINGILSTAPPKYVIARDGVTYRFQYCSLIEALAAQFIQDRRGGNILNFCKNRKCDNKIFFHSDPRTEFCSIRCGNAERQRKYREGAKRPKTAATKRRRK
jgi:hypothetical protein